MDLDWRVSGGNNHGDLAGFRDLGRLSNKAETEAEKVIVSTQAQLTSRFQA